MIFKMQKHNGKPLLMPVTTAPVAAVAPAPAAPAPKLHRPARAARVAAPAIPAASDAGSEVDLSTNPLACKHCAFVATSEFGRDAHTASQHKGV